MTVLTGTLSTYTEGRLVLPKEVNLATDTLKALLLTNSYTPALSTDTLAGITANECSGAGYSRVTISGKSVTESSGDILFTFDDIVFTANGAGINNIRYCAVYDDTLAGDNLLYLIDLTGGSPVNFSITDGNNITVDLPAALITMEFSA